MTETQKLFFRSSNIAVVEFGKIPPFLFLWSFSAQNPDWAPHCLIWHIIESRTETNANNTNIISFGSKIVCVYEKVWKYHEEGEKKTETRMRERRGEKVNETSQPVRQSPQKLVYKSSKMDLKMLRKHV